MNRVAAVIVESVTVVVLAGVLGFVVNRVHPNGLAIDRDHFFASNRPDPAGSEPPPGASRDDGARVKDPEAEVRDRLVSLGLQPISQEQVLADFDDELYQLYDAYTFVDARNEANYRDGHIPGAWHFDPYHVDRHASVVAPQAQSSPKVIVYCNGGACVDSELAAQHLVNLGVPKETIFVYVGGIQAWKKAGRPVEKGDRKSGQLVTEAAHGG